MDLLIW